MISIVDYGMGNLYSVSKAIERLGYEAIVSSDSETIIASEGVILPGVGAFGDAMHNLEKTGLDQVVKHIADSGKPLLGICLGMQLLFSESEEYGLHQGLNILPGRVVKFEGNVKVPHMGWNRLTFMREDPILEGLTEDYVYFVHSYHVLPDRKEDLLAITNYAHDVTAVVGRGNVYGMQFHPEKSGDTGMKLLDGILSRIVTQKG